MQCFCSLFCTTNTEERTKALHKAEDLIFDSIPIIPIIYRMDPFMINPKLKGAIFNPLGRYRFHYAYLEKKQFIEINTNYFKLL